MTTLLDILSSFFIGGIVTSMMIYLSIHSSVQRNISDAELQLQQNAKTIAEIVNYDLRKIGFNYNGTPIVAAQPQRISYYADADSNGVAELITYTLGDSTQALSTANPRDKILFRIVNGDSSLSPSLGIVDAKFSYMNLGGQQTSILDSIKYIGMEIWLESLYETENQYLKTYWEITVHPRNI